MFDKKPTPYSDMFFLIDPSKRLNPLSQDPYVAEGRLAMPYRYFAGPVATRFFAEIRDHQRIMGLKCCGCGTVYIPVESICGRCFKKAEEWVEVGKQGVLQSYAVTHYQLPVHPTPMPVMYGLIRLDGADTDLLHLLGEVEPQTLRIGMRVEALFREKRVGNILDIQYFRPVPRVTAS